MRLWFFSLLILPALAWGDFDAILHVLQQEPQLKQFEFCQGGGCQTVQSVSLDEDEWQEVRDLFDPEPKNAEEERHQIGYAIALMARLSA